MHATTCIAVLTLLLALAILVVPLATEAQQPRKVHRIGYLSSQSPTAESSRLDAFRQALRDLGYVDEQDILIEYRFAEGQFDRLPDLAAELVRLRVDVMVTWGSPGTRAAQQATRTIPLVMTVVGDPIAAGFVASLGRPGGNITGLTQVSPQLSGKRLELLKEALPKISRAVVFVDRTSATAQQTSVSLRETQLVAEALGIKLQSVEVRGPNPDLDGAFKTAASQRAGALIVLAGPVLELQRKRVVALAAKSRLPAMYSNRQFVEAGGLMSYGPNLVDLFRRAATYVDKILKGTQPADLPVEQPTKFELVINMKTAKALGLTIPPSLLLRAEQVIE